MSEPPPGWRERRQLELLGWGLCLASLGWAYTVHQGLGPAPYALAPSWYEPRGFMHGWGFLAWAFEHTLRLLVVLALPSSLLAIGVFLASRSALARALALAAVAAVLLFGFYGTRAARVWELFFWRGSAVLTLTALAVGFALAAPLLARSWLRLGWPLRLACYLPLAFVVVAFVRNATGTNPELRYAISPWPAVSFYGIELAGLFATLAFAGAGSALLAITRWVGVRRILSGVTGGLLAPAAVLWLLGALAALPFRVDARALGATLALTVLTLAAALLLPRGSEGLTGRATALAVGAALLAAPILGAQLWARFDYYRTREHHARQIIDALERYLAREELYPDELAQLVEAGDLAAIPRPAIGFAILRDEEFGFSNFGTSYLLDFSAPRWVQCAYAPPYEDDEGEAQPSASDDGLAEAWSCPKRPPELW